MTPNTLRKALRKAGLHPQEQLAAMLAIQKTERELAEKTSAEASTDRRWNVLLGPLVKTIRGMQSTRATRWGNDPLRAPVYDKYLALLLKTRDRIKFTRVAPHKTYKTVREAAQALELDGDGTEWPHWISASTKEKVHAAFDYLYDIALPQAGRSERKDRGVFKRLIPFAVAGKSAASDKRWAILLGVLSVRIGQLGGDTESVYARAVYAAMERVRSHGSDEVAPANWVHLLAPDQRAEYDAWRNGSLNGHSDTPLTPEMLEAARTQYMEQMMATQQALATRKAAQLERRKEAARTYLREYQREQHHTPVGQQRGPYATKSGDDP